MSQESTNITEAFLRSLCAEGETTARPGEMYITQENLNVLTAHCKALGIVGEYFTAKNLKIAYNDARAEGKLSLVPFPVAPPQVIEVEVPVVPPDRRNTRDKLLDVGVAPTEHRSHSGREEQQKPADLQKAASEVISAVFRKGKVKPNETERDVVAGEDQLPIDITDAKVAANRKNISAAQLHDLFRRRGIRQQQGR